MPVETRIHIALVEDVPGQPLERLRSVVQLHGLHRILRGRNNVGKTRDGFECTSALRSCDHKGVLQLTLVILRTGVHCVPVVEAIEQQVVRCDHAVLARRVLNDPSEHLGRAFPSNIEAAGALLPCAWCVLTEDDCVFMFHVVVVVRWRFAARHALCFAQRLLAAR